MILATIMMTDGDKITMPFESLATLSLWLDDHIGTYTGYHVDANQQNGGNDGGSADRLPVTL